MRYMLLVHRWREDWAGLRSVPAYLGTWISIFLSRGPCRTVPEITDLSSQQGLESPCSVSGWRCGLHGVHLHHIPARALCHRCHPDCSGRELCALPLPHACQPLGGGSGVKEWLEQMVFLSTKKKILGKSLGTVGNSAWHTVGLLRRMNKSSRGEYIPGPQHLQMGAMCLCDVGQLAR